MSGESPQETGKSKEKREELIHESSSNYKPEVDKEENPLSKSRYKN